MDDRKHRLVAPERDTMLYQFHEINRTLLNPLVQWAEASSKLFSNPVSPLAHTPFSQRIAAGYELMYRLGKDYEKPPFGITTTVVDDKEVPIMELVAVNKPFCRLLHFKKDFPAGRTGCAPVRPSFHAVARNRARAGEAA
jgi:poly(3-hydroxybutyrate) depolymerase